MATTNGSLANALTDRRTIFFCLLTAVCEGLDLQAAGVAAAGIRPEFNPTSGALGYFFSASTMGLFLGAVLGGRLSDRIGRKGVLVVSVALFGLFSLLTSFAWNVPSLIAARFLTGLGLGGALPNMLALTAESSSADRRSANVTLVYAGTPFGGGVASLISLWLPAEQWRWIFIVGGVLPLLLAPCMAFALQESPAFRYLQARSAEVMHMPKAGSFLAILQEGRALRTVLLWGAFFLALLTLYLLLNWLPTLLVSNGFTKSQATIAQVGLNAGGVVTALWIGQLMEGAARRPGIVVIFVALPLLLVWLANASANVATLYLIVTVLGAAIVGAQAILYATAPACYPTSIRGVGVGASVAIGRIGSIVGPLFAASLLTAGQSPSQVIMGLLPITIVGGIAAIVLAYLVPPKQVE